MWFNMYIDGCKDFSNELLCLNHVVNDMKNHKNEG
jgi:hypothetical protein